MNLPLVSVIIPTYNRKEYVQKAIDSVLIQTYVNYEIIVVDDGSRDGTSIALQKRYKDKIVYLWQENQGESVARNKGISLAKGSMIAFLDSDDVWIQDKLEKQVAALLNNPNAVLCCGQSWAIDSSGNVVDPIPLGYGLREIDFELGKLCLRNHVFNSTVTVKRSCLAQTGNFDSQITFGEDWDLWLRLRILGDFVFLGEPLAYIRRHSSSQSQSGAITRNDLILQDHLKILEKLFSTWQESSPKLREKALSQRFFELSMMDYISGRAEYGQNKLLQAIQLNEEIKNQKNEFWKKLVYATLAGRPVNLESVQTTIRVVKNTAKQVPETFVLSEKEWKRVLSHIYEIYTFIAGSKQDWLLVKQCYPKALLYNFKLVANYGLIKIGLRAFLSSYRKAGLLDS